MNQVALDVARGRGDQSSGPHAGEEDIVKILKLVLQKVEACTLIADGLDEWPWYDSSSRADRDSATGLFSASAEVSADTKTRVLLVSRRKGLIKTAFASNFMLSQKVAATEYKIQSDDVTKDVTTVSQVIVARRLAKKSEEERSYLAQQMVDKSEDIFL
ncbi:hypothetical protein PspLS_11496 [Pyricularia sp. CBS 133598]|nr:hypothetical protein PspLS_11496 [Pyricularia sp. CBS 133598]